jgi:hypothetical protein
VTDVVTTGSGVIERGGKLEAIGLETKNGGNGGNTGTKMQKPRKDAGLQGVGQTGTERENIQKERFFQSINCTGAVFSGPSNVRFCPMPCPVLCPSPRLLSVA